MKNLLFVALAFVAISLHLSSQSIEFDRVSITDGGINYPELYKNISKLGGNGYEGFCEFIALIDETGHAKEVIIEKSNGILDTSIIIQSLKMSIHKPSIQNNQAIASWVQGCAIMFSSPFVPVAKEPKETDDDLPEYPETEPKFDYDEIYNNIGSIDSIQCAQEIELVYARVFIKKDGTAGKIKFEIDTCKSLCAVVEAGLRRTKFKPATFDGTNVGIWYEIPIQLKYLKASDQSK